MMERISRRDFLKKMGNAVILAVFPSHIGACGGDGQGEDVTNKKRYSVYISKFSSYSEETYDSLKNTTGEMVETLYNKNPFFSRGDKVSIKVNLVGSTDCLGMSANLTYVTNPIVVKALGEILIDLGASSLFIIEGATQPSDSLQVFSELGYDEAASYLGAQLIDLNKPDPYSSFHEATIEDGLVYSTIMAHEHLFETDCLISVAKLKCHSMAGVTLSLKNLIGFLPIQEYGLDGTGSRIEYVHAPDPTTQIPYNIIDLARLFPIDFAFIDGITAIDKGEGPWAEGISYVTPGVLIAGNNSVATDSVGTFIMEFDPTTVYPNSPFVNCYNHIQLATDYNVGSNILDEIEILGESLSDVTYPYVPPEPSSSNLPFPLK